MNNQTSKEFIVFLLFMVLLFSACATQTAQKPMVDSNANRTKFNTEKDRKECHSLAEQASNETETETVGKKLEIRSNVNYKYFFRNCMTNRGHEVLN